MQTIFHNLFHSLTIMLFFEILLVFVIWFISLLEWFHPNTYIVHEEHNLPHFVFTETSILKLYFQMSSKNYKKHSILHGLISSFSSVQLMFIKSFLNYHKLGILIYIIKYMFSNEKITNLNYYNTIFTSLKLLFILLIIQLYCIINKPYIYIDLFNQEQKIYILHFSMYILIPIFAIIQLYN